MKVIGCNLIFGCCRLSFINDDNQDSNGGLVPEKNYDLPAQEAFERYQRKKFFAKTTAS